MNIRQLWKAYYQGYRKAWRHRKYVYYVNPYTNHTPQWYAFCQGFNDMKAGIRI